MKKVVPFTCVLLFISFAACHALAGVFHVSTGGEDNAACGAAGSPCLTLWQAIHNAGTGENLIKIAAGNYSETNVLNANGLNLTFQGGWNQTFTSQQCSAENTAISISAAGTTFSIVATSGASIHASFQCLRLTATENNHNVGISVTADGTGSTVQFAMSGCKIDSYDYHGLQMTANHSGQINATIEESSISDNIQEFDEGQSGAGMRVDALAGSDIALILRKNRISGNLALSAGGGVIVKAASSGSIIGTFENNIIAGNQGEPGGGIYAESYMDVSTGDIDLRLTNNTITDNVSTGEGGGLYLRSASNTLKATLKNDIIWGNIGIGNGDDFIQDIVSFPVPSGNDGSGTSVDYSILGEVNVVRGNYTAGSHMYNVDPDLDDHYLLRNGSPAVNAGQCGWKLIISNYIRVAPYDDIQKESRPGFGIISGCDIGADEYHGLLCFPVKNSLGTITNICM